MFIFDIIERNFITLNVFKNQYYLLEYLLLNTCVI